MEDIKAETQPEASPKQKQALSLYRREIKKPKSLGTTLFLKNDFNGGTNNPQSDLGLKAESRAKLRSYCRNLLLGNKNISRRKYSNSHLSSSSGNAAVVNEKDDALSALRKLQKERLIISRMGFMERAYQLDIQIELYRNEAKKLRDQEMKKLYKDHAR